MTGRAAGRIPDPAADHTADQTGGPPGDGWRAAVPKPETLPHYPMLLHRGGFPDGS